MELLTYASCKAYVPLNSLMGYSTSIFGTWNFWWNEPRNFQWLLPTSPFAGMTIFIGSTSQHSNISNRNVRTIGIPRRKVGNILASKKTLSLGLQPFQKACQEMFGPPEQPPQNLQLRCHESLWIPTMGTKQHDFEGNIQNGKLGMVFLAHSTYNRTLVLCCVRTILYPVESWQHTDPLLSRWDAHLEKTVTTSRALRGVWFREYRGWN